MSQLCNALTFTAVHYDFPVIFSPSLFCPSQNLISHTISIVYDASGYYGGNVYGGNNYRLGDPELCRTLNDHAKDRSARNMAEPMPTIHENAQHITFNPLANVPFPVHTVTVHYRATIAGASVESIAIHQTSCMPKSCSHQDLLQVMSFANVSHLRNSLIMGNVELIDLRILQQSYDVRMDVAFVIFM